MTDDLVVIWDGARHGGDWDLLCVPIIDPPTKHSRTPERVYNHWTSERVKVLALLEQRPDWQLRDLADAAEMPVHALYAIAKAWKAHGTVVSTGVGRIAIRREHAA